MHDEVRWCSVNDVAYHARSGEDDENVWNLLINVLFAARSDRVVQLKRGYTEEARLSDGQPCFSDLILVIHGIGEKNADNPISKKTTL